VRTVKEVSDLAGISVRTLHYYDQIGLLKPAIVEANGYRRYGGAELERLQEILLLRELGFDLSGIRRIVDGSRHARREALLQHRGALVVRHERLARMIEAIDETIATMGRGIDLDEHKMLEPFDAKQEARYRKEAEQRWGTEVVAESYRHINKLSKEQRQALFAEAGAIERDAAALMDYAPDDPRVRAVMARWFAYIDQSFYRVTPEIFRGLGDGYVQDPRFAAHYEAVKPGLAQFMRDAMHAYCDALVAEPER